MEIQEMVSASNDKMVKQIPEMRAKARHEEPSSIQDCIRRRREDVKKEQKKV